MTKQLMILAVCNMGLLTGCALFHSDRQEPADDTLITRPALNPRANILFPKYFLLDEFALNDHGHIPATPLIGAGMTTSLDLATVRSRLNDQLKEHEWKTDRMEIGKQSFRVMASHNGEAVEIRAVQGTGPTQIFLLYTPATD